MAPQRDSSASRSTESDTLLPPESVFSMESSGDLGYFNDGSQWADKAPERLLAFFCGIMFLVWFDNGLFASNGVTGCSKDCDDPVGFPTTQGDFGLSKFQLGVLAAMFMVGLMVASVLLTQFMGALSPFRLIGLGMGIWVLAAIGSGLSHGFWSLLVARVMVGAGEASIITLSAPFIDDVAPPGRVSLWFAILSSAPPLGVAAGYIFGGVAEVIGWRACFYIEALLGVPLVLISVFVPDVKLRTKQSLAKHEENIGAGSSAKKDGALKRLWNEVKILHRHPCFVLNTFATTPIQAAVGAFTFWGPKVAMEVFHLSSDAANLSLGVVTIVCALVGILGGGCLLDLLGSTIRYALAIQLASSLTGLLFCALAVTLIKSTFWAFCILFGLGLCGLFAATAPLYAVGMWSIPLPQRPAGQAYLVVAMHLLGDVPSPPIVGALQGWIHNWHISLLAVVLYLSVAAALYSWSLTYSKDAPDYRDDSE